jgi:hypothetical protein
MKLINLKEFWEINSLRFDSFKKGLAWTKRHIDTQTIRRISADNYLIDSITANKAYKQYLLKQEIIYNERSTRAKLMTKQRTKKSE